MEEDQVLGLQFRRRIDEVIYMCGNYGYGDFTGAFILWRGGGGGRKERNISIIACRVCWRRSSCIVKCVGVL